MKLSLFHRKHVWSLSSGAVLNFSKKELSFNQKITNNWPKLLICSLDDTMVLDSLGPLIKIEDSQTSMIYYKLILFTQIMQVCFSFFTLGIILYFSVHFTLHQQCRLLLTCPSINVFV